MTEAATHQPLLQDGFCRPRIIRRKGAVLKAPARPATQAPGKPRSSTARASLRERFLISIAAATALALLVGFSQYGEYEISREQLRRSERSAERSSSRGVKLATLMTDLGPPSVPKASETKSSAHGLRRGVHRLGSFSVPIHTTTSVRQASVQRQQPMPALVEHSTDPVAIQKVESIIRKYAPKQQSPRALAEAIVHESRSQGMDPLFVAAVIKSESTFNHTARSHRGAQGLMQIMPATGAWIARKSNLPNLKLTNPKHNVKLGVSYLRHLEQNFEGNRVFALVAYNWGPGHVESAADGKKRIPKECLSYALKILSDYRSWRSGSI